MAESENSSQQWPDSVFKRLEKHLADSETISNWPDYILKRLMDDVSDVKCDVSILRTDLKSSLSGIETHVGAMVEAVRVDRERYDQEIDRLKERVDAHEVNLANIKADVRILAGKWAAAISIVVFVLQVLVQHIVKTPPP